jgi:glycosyltransferase involved in cell wall biosynthesis
MQKIYNYPPERVRYIPLGPRSVFLKWSALNNVREEDGTILFLGRIHKHKGLEYLVKAQPLIAKEIPSARIIIAGQGEDLDRCKGFITDHNRFEVYDGFIQGEMVAELFQRASVVAVPYITAATSGILMTAYAFGKPVVVSKVGSLPEYVQDGITGFLVESEDENQLAEALIRILSNNDLRHQMGKNALQWIQHELGWVNIAEQTLKVYEIAKGIHENR